MEDRFFPDFVGSLASLDKLFTDFDNMKGKCIPIPMLIDQISAEGEDNENILSLVKSFDEAKENLSSKNNWAQFNVLRDHAMEIANQLQNESIFDLFKPHSGS